MERLIICLYTKLDLFIYRVIKGFHTKNKSRSTLDKYLFHILGLPFAAGQTTTNKVPQWLSLVIYPWADFIRQIYASRHSISC